MCRLHGVPGAEGLRLETAMEFHFCFVLGLLLGANYRQFITMTVEKKNVTHEGMKKGDLISEEQAI